MKISQNFVAFSEYMNFTNWRILFWLSYTAFLFDLLLEARAEILTNISLVFLGDMKTQKWHFEINWPVTKFQFKILKSQWKSEAIENDLKLKKRYRFQAGQSFVLNFNN